MRQQVFISYHHADIRLADELCEALEKRGMRPRLDTHISGGSDWHMHVGDAIEQCDVFLLLLTPMSAQSNWVRRELQYALEQGKQILPVSLGPLRDTDIPPELADIRVYDLPLFWASDATEEMAKLADEVASRVRSDVARDEVSFDTAFSAESRPDELPTPGAGESAAERVTVTVLDVTRERQQKATLPTNAPVRRVITKLVQMMNLPTVGPHGDAMSYKFHHKASGKQLTDEQTLAQAGVQDGNVLGLQSVIFDRARAPMQPARAPGKVNVLIMDATGNKEQQATVPSDAAVRRIIAKLVQMMGLPSVGPDGQPMSYKFHHKASGRQLMDEQTLAEAAVQDGDVLRLMPEITAGGGPPGLMQLISLRLSAFHPREVMAEKVERLVAYAHLESARSEVARHALETLELDAEEVRAVSEAAPEPVSREAEIQVVPQVEGLTFSPTQQFLSLLWEDWQAVQFRFRASAEHAGGACNGTVMFLIEGVLIADVPVSVFVRAADAEEVFGEEMAEAAASPYRKVFPSHSHQDVEVVQRCERYAAWCGDAYLRDAVSLRSGEEWSPRLLELIDEADVFQLFWSDKAAASAYVEEEWRHALKHERGPSFIRPVYWRQPMPAPPAELEHIHFAYVELS